MPKPKAVKPDPALVQLVINTVHARLASEFAPPEGAAAAPFDFLKTFGKHAPKLIPIAVEFALAGVDGQISPAEIQALVGKIAGFIRSLREPAAA